MRISLGHSSRLLFFVFLCAALGWGGVARAQEAPKEAPNSEDAATQEADDKSKESTYELLNLFGDVFERVKRDYVEEVTDDRLVEAALNGMLADLDPHSGYLNEKNFKEMQVQTKGEFGGLGIEVTMENGFVKVVSPIDDTPAYKAGVEAGDFITKIDDEPVLGMSLSDAVEKMRGPVGTEVTLTIARASSPEPVKIPIKRDLIKIKSVRYQPMGDIGYIRVTSFSEQTDAGLERAVKDLSKQIKNMKGIVLDLRNNPGGLLDQAIAISDAFLDYGEIVSTRERDPDNTKRFSAKQGDLIHGLPMVVLINNGSASASEIVAGALKDHKRAVVMGTRSFGKGSVQTVIPLKDHGAMRLTTSRYYTPSGVSIQAMGIEPDIVVEAATIKPIESEEERSEASLRGALTNGMEKDEDFLKRLEEIKRKEEKAKKDKENKDKNNGNGEETEDIETLRGVKASDDFQLTRAMDLLRGLDIYRKVAQ